MCNLDRRLADISLVEYKRMATNSIFGRVHLLRNRSIERICAVVLVWFGEGLAMDPRFAIGNSVARKPRSVGARVVCLRIFGDRPE